MTNIEISKMLDLIEDANARFSASTDIDFFYQKMYLIEQSFSKIRNSIFRKNIIKLIKHEIETKNQRMNN